MAEPAIVALQAIGSVLSIEKTPYLYYMINHQTTLLSATIGMGVGLAVSIGILKMKYDWKLRDLILLTLIPTLVISLIMSLDKTLAREIGLAWDCGAITTGEVTVPVVVALGGGISKSFGTKNPFAGLGIVTLGSILPITTVSLLSILVWLVVPLESITKKTHPLHNPWWEERGVVELIETLQITIPLIIFLFLLLRPLLKESSPLVTLSHLFEHDSDYQHRLKVLHGTETSRLNKINFLWVGLFLTVFGLYVFNVGINMGLAVLGYAVGGMVPKLFIDTVQYGPAMYSFDSGITLVLVFSFFLGYGATVAEPALEILGSEVEILSKKQFTKKLLIHSVSVGVGLGVLLGIIRVVWDIPIIYFLLPIYWICIVLTMFSHDAVLHVAWDAAAVTTGPVTVPLILGIGIATAIQVRSTEGFGILSLASLCPILVVLIVGLVIRLPSVAAWMAKSSGDDDDDHEEDSDDELPGIVYEEHPIVDPEAAHLLSQPKPTYHSTGGDNSMVELEVIGDGGRGGGGDSVEEKGDSEEDLKGVYSGIGNVYVL
eukprot:TRINITY_DN7259_c0_g1_i4.p1 TRINITY_DN7259_c0_g1~~TRINITY_DN7259_c0_g1_i4.p1  ORF type:complete len:544 (-),score=113.48 TRINITY_DN7259_c0_g1_i4:344-1975(-)